ncbi:hypothetical protein BHE74_00037437 [Ensete ventricosum]|nr:hypothetical protein GW17_00005846 [Ensete ventricosum]RWW55884.1 hypothetical protein BHE74_00037437 [Ensete ventricosum]RZS11492.1 hypothetical protein BHM03_00042820 [Ensete ventricosum]
MRLSSLNTEERVVSCHSCCKRHFTIGTSDRQASPSFAQKPVDFRWGELMPSQSPVGRHPPPSSSLRHAKEIWGGRLAAIAKLKLR